MTSCVRAGLLMETGQAFLYVARLAQGNVCATSLIGLVPRKIEPFEVIDGRF